jgi:hypothetical protein
MMRPNRKEPRRRFILPLAMAAPLLMSACSGMVTSTPNAYDAPPGNGWYDERQVPVYGSPGYPPLYTYQTLQPRPAPPPPQFAQPDLDNGGGSNLLPLPRRMPPVAVRPPEPSAPRDDDPDNGSSTPQPAEPHMPPPNVEAGGPHPAPPRPPGEYCGWWDLCHLWE